MKTWAAFFILVIFLITGAPAQCQAPSENNWSHFRGSNLNGIAAVDLAPVKWTSDSNIVWRSEIHGRGWSSPVIYGNQVWVSTATENGDELYAVCFDYETGKTIYDIKLFQPETVYQKHDINSYATPTPCIDDKYVYMHFGRYGTSCINTDNGSVVWERTDLICNHVQGPGSSPILYNELLILHLEGIDTQKIIALDKTSGKTVWIAERPSDIYNAIEPIGRKAYITPIVIKVNGKELLISNGSAACIAYDVHTGEEIWRFIRGEDSTISMPVFENGTVYFHTSFLTTEEDGRFAEFIAFNPRGTGNLTGTNVIWRMKTPILQLSSPLISQGLIYTIDSKSILMCIEASNGHIIWSKKLKGKYNASPVLADGKIYICSTKGETLVIKEGKKLEILSENELEGEIWASPAILRDNILIRTSNYLYRIGIAH